MALAFCIKSSDLPVDLKGLLNPISVFWFSGGHNRNVCFWKIILTAVFQVDWRGQRLEKGKPFINAELWYL